MAHRNVNVVPDEFRKLDTNTSRVDKCNLRLLSISHIKSIVQKVINAEAPLVPTEIRIKVNGIDATFNLAVKYLSEANLGVLRVVHGILEIETDNWLLDLSLHVKQLDVINLLTVSVSQSQHSLVCVGIAFERCIHKWHVFGAQACIVWALQLCLVNQAHTLVVDWASDFLVTKFDSLRHWITVHVDPRSLRIRANYFELVIVDDCPLAEGVIAHLQRNHACRCCTDVKWSEEFVWHLLVVDRDDVRRCLHDRMLDQLFICLRLIKQWQIGG